MPAFLWLPLPPLTHALQRLAASSTMAREGAAVAGECWSAVIPVPLWLADSETPSLEQPPTLYALVPRQSYLHSLVPAALRALQHLLPPGEDAPWFEHGRLPLKWNVPAGVMYDLVAAPSNELPWRLTIHFRGFPSKSCLPMAARLRCGATPSSRRRQWCAAAQRSV